MKKVFAAGVCICICNMLLAQNSFIIHGKIERLSQSKSVTVAGGYGTFSGSISPDGSFLIRGDSIKPGFALMYTDSSGADAIWLAPGQYEIECKEIHMDGSSRVLFRIPQLKGPRDAEIDHGFKEPFYYLNADSPEERKRIRSSFAKNYIDSIVQVAPASLALPAMLRMSISLLDDIVIKNYYAGLSEEQKAQPEAKQILAYYERKGKVETEKIFEDFSLRTTAGKTFQLSALTNKKLILIDFWASWCGPCRRKHQRLVELYKKYASKGLEIVSISLDDDKRDWVAATKKDNMTWINVSELKGWNTAIAKSYSVSSIPFSFLLDKNRRIISTESTLTDKEIEKYLASF